MFLFFFNADAKRSVMQRHSPVSCCFSAIVFNVSYPIQELKSTEKIFLAIEIKPHTHYTVYVG